jgi:hypothetical protein
MAQSLVDYVYLELLEDSVELKHHSHWSTVLGETLCTLRGRTSHLLMAIHQLWIPK